MQINAQRLIAACLFALAALPSAGAGELAAYQPREKIEGEIRIWGTPPDGELLKAWEQGFARLHPGVTFSEKLYGPESAMAGVYNDVADLALMGREMRMPVDSMAFEWVHGYKATSIVVANAGMRDERPNTTLGIFVHKDNPLARLSIAQLDAVLGGEHKRGPANARTWGDVGLTGAWQDRPIAVYGPKLDSASALFVRHVVLADSRKWNPAYREAGTQGIDIVAALQKDPAGIAIASVSAASPGVKVLELATNEAGPYVAPSLETIVARTYPLSRAVSVVINRAPGKPVAPKVREFLSYILSKDGQAEIARDGAHVPLDADSASAQSKRLD
jgi:phosphate transport system substrate-binding protein